MVGSHLDNLGNLVELDKQKTMSSSDEPQQNNVPHDHEHDEHQPPADTTMSCGADAKTEYLEEGFDPTDFEWGHPLAEEVYLSVRNIYSLKIRM